MPKRVARAIVGLIKETAVGTPLEPAAGDSFYARNITIPDPPEPIRRNDTRKDFGKNDNVANPVRQGEIGFVVDWLGASAAGTAPYYRKLMLACGFRESDNGVIDVTYLPWATADNATAVGPPATENPYASASLNVWEEGSRYGLMGSNGNVIIRGTGGNIVEAEFKFKGAIQDVFDDVTPPAGVNPSAITPLTISATPISIHGVTTLAWDSFEFDPGNEVVPLSDAQKAGYQYATWVVNRKPTLKVVFDMVDVATFDFYGRQKSQVTGALTLGRIGSVNGNRFQISATRTQVVKVTPNERDGGRTVEVTLDLMAGPTGAEGSECSLIWD